MGALDWRNKMAIELIFPNNTIQLSMFLLVLCSVGFRYRKLLMVSKQGSWWNACKIGRWASFLPTASVSDIGVI